MSGEPLTNAAVAYLRRLHEEMNSLGKPPSSHEMTDDFLAEDRRARTGGVNFGRLDGKGFSEAYNMAFELGSRRPTFSISDVFAVRGQCLAALTEKTDYGNDMHSEFFLIIQLDPSLQRHRRSIVFDPDDVDAVTAELDRLHAEIEQT